MITFQVSTSFKIKYKNQEKLLYRLYEYLDTILRDSLQYNLSVHFDLMTNQYELDQYDAYTIINEWNPNNFPKKSTIYVADFVTKKHFYYTLLHELFHALGLMYIPGTNVRWNTLIDKISKEYIGKKNSKAIFYYCKRFKTNKNSIPLQKSSNPDTLTDYHHLTESIKDVFSSPLYYTISPITLGLLDDYGYNINF
jgi:hypothetical protein